MTVLLDVEALSVAYGGLRAVWSVDLHVDEGEAIGIAGPNGAGKSSLLRALAGIEPAERGRIRFRDEVLADVAAGRRHRPHAAVRRGLILAPEGRRLFGDLTVEDNLRFGAGVRRSRSVAGDLAKVYALFPALATARHRTAATLSGGEQQMVTIGRALMAKPTLLMVDELSLGLAPVIASEIAVTLARLRREEGMSMIVVDESLTQLTRIVSRIVFLSRGRKRGEELAGDVDVARAASLYLGDEAPR